MITLDDVSFTYPGSAEPTLSGLSLDLIKGEVFGLLGPSGSGKSTTQRLAMGLLRGFSGKATVFGDAVGKVSRDFYNRIGVSFELPTLYMRLTALENLNLYASLYSGTTLKPMDLLARVGLEGDANKRVSAFSKGMKMRLNLCRALINDPDLLFLDEPTTGQDPARARKTRDLIRELNSAGKTIFLTTHNMAEADEICHRVGFLVEGRADVIDTPAVLKKRHGENILQVVTRSQKGERQVQRFPMTGLGENDAFLSMVKAGGVETMHSLEASLDDVFIKVAGGTDA